MPPDATAATSVPLAERVAQGGHVAAAGGDSRTRELAWIVGSVTLNRTFTEGPLDCTTRPTAPGTGVPLVPSRSTARHAFVTP